MSISAASRPSPSPQPPGLLRVCLIEGGERAAGSVLAALLVLYLNEHWRLPAGDAAAAQGWFMALSYGAGVLGGVLSDRRLGYRRAITLGLGFMLAGYTALVFDRPAALLAGLLLLILGHGLFKPSITALLGALYGPGDTRRSAGFSAFYIAVNVASCIGPLAAGAVRARLGFVPALALASVGIAAALVTLALSRRELTPAPAVSVAGPAPGPGPGAGAVPAPAPPETAADLRARAQAVALLLAISIVFSVAYFQSYGTLLLFARDRVERALLGTVVPPEAFAALPAALVILLAPGLEALWTALRRRGTEPTAMAKILTGLVLTAAAFVLLCAAAASAQGRLVSPLWLLVAKLALTLGELLIEPVTMEQVALLAPARHRALSLGLLFGSHAVGNWLAGLFGGLWGTLSEPGFFFAASLVPLLGTLAAWRVAGRLRLPSA